MIDALVSGRLAADPKHATASNGNAYATARVIVSTGGEDSLLVGAIAFEPAAVQALLALGKGDAVALAGELRPKLWTKDGEPRVSADMTVHAVLSAYNVRRKRQAMQAEAA